VPKQVLDAIPPRPPGFGRHRELFPRTTGDRFDPLSPATVASDVTIGFVLQLDRSARMLAQHAVDPTLPGLLEVIDRLSKATFDAPAATPYEAAIRRAQLQGACNRVAETEQAGGADARGGGSGGGGAGSARPVGGRYQALLGSSRGVGADAGADAGARCAPGRSDRRMSQDWLAPWR